MPICKNCSHNLLEHKGSDGKTKILHYNRSYFGMAAINHKWCSSCEVMAVNDNSKEVCNNPEKKDSKI